MTATRTAISPRAYVGDDDGSRRAGPGDRPLSDILAGLGHDVSELVQAQLDLAKLELREDLRNAGRVAAMGSGAAAMALAALLLAGMAGAWAIAEAWPAWSGFLIVAVVYGVVAGALALRARQRLEPLTEGPTRTIEELQEDARWLRQHRN